MTRPTCLEAASTVKCRPVTCMYVSLKVELASWHVTFAHEHFLDNVKPSRPKGPWRLVLFNTSKCKVMHIGKPSFQRQYYMNTQQLEVVCYEKDLGIAISNDLKVSQQC